MARIVGDVPLGGSPFPPIADYALPVGLRDDARSSRPTGNVEWLCLPRMDSPSVFGAILDRDAGGFRLGPADTSVPAGRRYLPGHDGPRDELGHDDAAGSSSATCCSIGPWHHDDDRSDTHRRAPTDYDADHVLLRTVRCVNGEVQLVARLRAGVRLRPRAARAGSTPATATTRRSPRARGLDVELRARPPTCASASRAAAPRRAHAAARRATSAFVRAVVERARGADDLRRGLRAARLDRAPLAALARARQLPRPPVARRTCSAAR